MIKAYTSGAVALALFAGAAGAIAPSRASAAVTINVREVGGNVVATTNGSLNISNLELLGRGGSVAAGFNPGFGVFSAVAGQVDSYAGLGGPAAFGNPSAFFLAATTAVGTQLRIRGTTGTIDLPAGYLTGASLGAVTTFVGQTFGTLGLATGVYRYSIPRDVITINITNIAAAVPEPSTWMTMLVGFGMMGAAMRYRRRTRNVAFG